MYRRVQSDYRNTELWIFEFEMLHVAPCECLFMRRRDYPHNPHTQDSSTEIIASFKQKLEVRRMRVICTGHCLEKPKGRKQELPGCNRPSSKMCRRRI